MQTLKELDNQKQKKTLFSIVGATGIGKTKLAIELAQILGTEIISCDSRQFFREMKIGTAVPSEEELNLIKQHFIGHLSIKDYYSIGQYEIDCEEKIQNLFQNYNDLILVGGSGMYEKAATEGLNNLPQANAKHVSQLENILLTEGIEKLQKILKELDNDYYSVVDIQNPRRLIRAIDIIWQTGKSYSELISKNVEAKNFNLIRIGITAPREILYEKINQRVDIMIENGLIEEVKNLIDFRNLTALQTVGYKELFNFFDGIWNLDFAIEEIKKNTRRYAKRQITWNKKISDIHWLPYDYSKIELLSLLERLKN